jgi:uncharacterized protein YkwD
MMARMAAADARAQTARRALAVGLWLLAPLAASADPASVVNELRVRGCAGTPAVGVAARRDSALDAAARELARGAKLGDALARVAYSTTSSTSFHVRGSADDAVVRDMLAQRYCALLNEAKFVELGAHQSGAETWIVMAAGRVAAPFAALQDPAAVAQRVLGLINAARAQPRRCGRDRYEAAPPVTMSTTLTAAAALHSLDMAQRGELGHDGSDGSTSGDRMTRAGYGWRGSGENIASGQPDADTVVQGWLDSPGHCATLMEPRFTETGVAFALAPGKNPAVYWTQVFATPR